MSVASPHPNSLCHRCAYLRLVQSKRSTFLMCEHPDLPKYGPQPVTRCSFFAPRGEGA